MQERIGLGERVVVVLAPADPKEDECSQEES